MIFVCPLADVPETVRRSGATRLITLLTEENAVARPAGIAPEHHLIVPVHDIVEPQDGCTLCAEHHIEDLLAFVRAWDIGAPLVIHCWAGISRSTAAALVTACALSPARDERDIARALRAASPTATPNGRIVALADDILGRGGRMRAAAAAIGRGADAIHGVPFMLALDRGTA
jgi:predicted protein tyrosine phosphatase